MAVDVALMHRARRTGEAVFRIYSWATPTLSFGRNQTALGRYDLERIRAQGIDVVRRPTGGRAILHWREVTYSVTAPVPDGVSVTQSYTRINALLLDGLLRLGVPAELADPERHATRPNDSPCFATPSAGEMTLRGPLAGRKLAGSAQWRDDHALLQHGSILVEDDQATLATLMIAPPAAPLPVGTLREALGRSPDPREVADVMFAAVRAHEDDRATALDADDVVRDARETLPLFLDDQWTWRR